MIRAGAMERNRAVWDQLKMRSEMKSYGLNAAQFFGLGLEVVREAIEFLPDAVAAMIVPIPELQYRPSFYHMSNDDIYRTQRKQMSIKATVKINQNGCARAEGWESVRPMLRSSNCYLQEAERSAFGIYLLVWLLQYSSVVPANKIARSLVKQTERKEEANVSKETVDEAELAVRANNITSYLEMRNVPFSQTLAVRRSPIHGWGLFALKDVRVVAICVAHIILFDFVPRTDCVVCAVVLIVAFSVPARGDDRGIRGRGYSGRNGRCTRATLRGRRAR